MEIEQEREKVKKEFLKNAENLLELNYPFLKNISSNSGKSATLNLDRREILSKIANCKTIKEFLNSNPKMKCCVIENKYFLMRLENDTS